MNRRRKRLTISQNTRIDANARRPMVEDLSNVNPCFDGGKSLLLRRMNGGIGNEIGIVIINDDE